MSKWVAIWGSAPSYTAAVPARYAKDVTLRYNMRSLLGGGKMRLHLNNLYGREAAVITRVFLVHGDAAVPVTFGGETACSLPAGAQVMSDEIDFPIARGEDFAVTMYLGDMTPLHTGTKHYGPLSSFAFAEGDHAAEAALPPEHSAPTETVYFLDTVDLLTEDGQAHALVCFGDSITAQSWPDYLALRVLREGPEHLAVVRRGIGGSRVLRAYGYMQHRHYGSRGIERFERELSAAGVDSVVILHGINDLIHPGTNDLRPWSELPTAEELIDGLRFYVRKGHEMGLRVYPATIPTLKGWNIYVPKRDEIRHAVNEWIRAQSEADGFVDFDAITRSADDPDSRDPECDVGDHIHPSLEGARRMAEGVPAQYLK